MPRRRTKARAWTPNFRASFIAPEVEVEKDTVVRLAAHLEANAEIAAVCPALFTPDGRPAHELHKLPTPDLLKRAGTTRRAPGYRARSEQWSGQRAVPEPCRSHGP